MIPASENTFLKSASEVLIDITLTGILGPEPEKISGKIILVHCSYIECGFIRKILKLRKKDPLPFLVLDTMEIERKLNMANPNIDVRLSSIRERRHLPEYEAHNALIDSLATAEVFLAQIRDVFKNKPATILPLYKRSL